MADFSANGGRIEIAELHTPAEFSRLKETTLVNATGYTARTLFGDHSIVPVRGQLARTIPDAAVNWRSLYKGVGFVRRRDGLVFQVAGDNDYYGYNDDSETPDRAEPMKHLPLQRRSAKSISAVLARRPLRLIQLHFPMFDQFFQPLAVVSECADVIAVAAHITPAAIDQRRPTVGFL
jgi:glycine/D-amino acid oxidase-like deaminating enzyme